MLRGVYLGKDIRTEKEVALSLSGIKDSTPIFFMNWYAIEGSYNVMVIDRFDVFLDKSSEEHHCHRWRFIRCIIC